MEVFNFGRGRSRLFQVQHKRLRPQESLESPILLDVDFDQQDDFMLDYQNEEIAIPIEIETTLEPILIPNHNADENAIVLDVFVEFLKGSKLLQGTEQQVSYLNNIYIY
jgi:hypothetical protein